MNDLTTPLQDDAVIIDCGKLSNIKWPGKVSAQQLIADGFTTDEVLQKAVNEINDYYVPVNPGARTRCIDGRQDPEFDEENLGPQVPGGAPGAALAYRLGVDKDDLTRGTFLTDAEAMVSSFVRLGLPIGGHRDENSEGKSTVGCGAIDAMDVVLARLTDPNLVDDQKRVVKLLLGKDFDRDVFLRDMGAAVVVNGRAADYFRDREKIIDVLEKTQKGSVSTLRGDHKECLVVANFVPNSTISSSRFSENFGGVQAFGYDIWRSKEVAKKILPLPDQDQDRERYVMARVMSTVATLMALTDGSQHLLIRVPAPAEEL